MRTNYSLEAPESYKILSSSGLMKIEGVDDGNDFKRTISCMESIGLSAIDIKNVCDLISALLSLGNVAYEQNE